VKISEVRSNRIHETHVAEVGNMP